MRAELLPKQTTGAELYDPEDPEVSLENCRNLLLISIARAQREGFEETHQALVEVLRVITEECDPVLH